MRIVKLTNAEARFTTLDGVRRFFLEEMPSRTPPGKFRVTPGRIAKDGLEPGEPIVFTFQARVVFTARAASGLLSNDDEESEKYPTCFLVDLSTLCEANEDFHDVERRYNQAASASVILVESQGWNSLPDSVHTDAIWTWLRKGETFTLTEEIIHPAGLVEGAISVISVNAYERNLEARRQCIAHYGESCSICGFNFGTVYGDMAMGFIHVHHLRSLSEIGHEYVVDPVEDLRPVCPNCHAVLHRRIPPYGIGEIQALLGQRRSRGISR
ncbi:MAG TPA: HNH endonuclease [Gemmataceae bacterium]|nr:HNH endonuclease [Gemmataceae bacterium]